MDQRQPQYPRPADRPLIQNPNHPPVSQPPARPYSTSSQPSFQIPPHDPFQRRAPDPFLPQPQTQRRGSYGLITSGRDGLPSSRVDRPPLGAAWTGSASSTPIHHSAGPSPTLQHPPTIGPPAGPSYTHERPGGGAGQYSAGPNEHHHPQPPPPSGFLNRQMPPPSPSQQSAPAPPYGAPRGPPPPPTFSSSRELPGLGPTLRHGAGMSISSILGDTTTVSQAPSYPHHASPAGTSRSPSSSSQRPVSPHLRGHSQSIASKLDTPWRRERTPDRHSHLPAGLRAQEGMSYSTNSSPAHFAPRGSPDFARAGPALFQQPYQAAPPRPFHGSPNERQRREPPRLEERVPPRPSSQPAGLAAHPNGQTSQREQIPPFGSRPPFATYPPPDRREDQRPSATSMHDQPLMSRERLPIGEPKSHSYSPSRTHERPKEIVSREAGRRDDISAPFRTGFRNQYYQPRGTIPPPEAPRSHPQSADPFEGPRDGPHFHQMPHERASNHPGDPPDRRTSEIHATMPDAHHQRLLRDDTPLAMQRSRSSLGLEGKRRASPLPQAVQGAQMQPTGAGSDPSIKSEFGRIFQGLGSGLGGSITPSRQSPMPQRNPPGADLDAVAGSDHEAARPGSTSKKHRRVKEEGAGPDDDDGRGTQFAPGTRGSKRAKAGHHHHVHPHHHHVHGHVHRLEEPAGAASAHHHHHVHAEHHHHHAAAGPPNVQQPAVIEVPEPKLMVHSQAVINSVKDRMRRHLGNELYEPKHSLPPGAMMSNIDDKFGYFLRYVPARSFSEMDFNCTYTVRIPRHMLTAEVRENICRNRNLFGTDIYTDDSDPIATLIHAGWLCGAWPEDTDVSLLNLPAPPTEEPGTELLDVPPSAPQVPPEEMDLHVTMLILPGLKRYAGCIRNGISSREWGNGAQHDGVSWMPVGMQWVDESCSRTQKRGGKARRQRLRDQQVEAAMALMGLSGGFNGGLEHARVVAGAA